MQTEDAVSSDCPERFYLPFDCYHWQCERKTLFLPTATTASLLFNGMRVAMRTDGAVPSDLWIAEKVGNVVH
jgi:hypothetical protein